MSVFVYWIFVAIQVARTTVRDFHCFAQAETMRAKSKAAGTVFFVVNKVFWQKEVDMLRGTLLLLSSGISLSAFAADIPATNCEIFLDRIQVTQSSHALTTVKFFIKTDARRMDGDVAYVGVYHNRNETRSDQQGNNFDFRVDSVSRFANSSDYFEFSADTGHDWMSAREEAAFFVQTTQGTRYWLNRANQAGQHFVLNGDMVNGLYRDAVKVFTWDGSQAQQTDSYPPDLAAIYNPKRCR
jgi:hypothetical protein